MKELSVEEKAQAYDNALEIISDYYQKIEYSSLSCASNDREVLEKAFPELAESEDERIRKELIRMVKEDWPGRGDVIDWLEKQGEKGTNGNNGEISFLAWSEDDEENLNWFEKFFRAESVIAEGRDIPQDRYMWFKNLKDRVQPQSQWKPSDEQMETLKYACGGNYVSLGILESLYQDLKKLKG